MRSFFCSRSGLALKHGKARVFYDLDQEFSSVVLTNLGKKGAKYNELEEVDEGRENTRAAIAGRKQQTTNKRALEGWNLAAVMI